MSPVTSLFRLLAASRGRDRDQWLDPDALARRRAVRLARLAGIADATPYYRDVFARAGLRPEDLAEATLSRLPLLEKAALQAAAAPGSTGPAGLIVNSSAKLSPVTTSGSTGASVRVLRSANDQAEVSAVWRRALRALGHGTFDRQADVSNGTAVAKSGPVVALRRLGLLPPIHYMTSFDHVDSQIDTLRRARPHTFSAYAVSLELIAERILELGITDIRPAVVISAAMSLSERGREITTRAFGVRPFDLYVAAELGLVGWECPVNRGVLHLNDDVQIVEILDDEQRPVAPGEIGEVVITQLHTVAQPLIRYRMGDMASRLPGHCPCGRGLGMLSPVQGRTRHVIRAPDGRVIFPMMVSIVVRSFSEVRRWQLRERAPGDLQLLVVPADHWQPAVGAEISRQLEARFGPAVRFEVVPVDDIPLAPSGKLQTMVPLEAGSQQR